MSLDIFFLDVILFVCLFVFVAYGIHLSGCFQAWSLLCL